MFTLGDDEPREGISSLDLTESIDNYESSKKKSSNSSSKKNKSIITPPSSHAQQLLDNAISAFGKTIEDDEIEGCLMILNGRLKKLGQEEKAIAIGSFKCKLQISK